MVKDGSGWGAMSGVNAAYLAKEGFSGSPAITVEDESLSYIWSDLGSKWYINEPVSYTHSPSPRDLSTSRMPSSA